jgi:hypothetical protein
LLPLIYSPPFHRSLFARIGSVSEPRLWQTI